MTETRHVTTKVCLVGDYGCGEVVCVEPWRIAIETASIGTPPSTAG